MKFAIYNGNRVLATKAVKGYCQGCNKELIARCGVFRIHHWAHKGSRTCDPWWETETEWHRSWKDNYNQDWQEKHLFDATTNELHIADVQTNYGVVIEFQHSRIDPNERIARERFYKRMIWVIDGTRLKRDYARFVKSQISLRTTNRQGIYLVPFKGECFPKTWIGSTQPVVFDFKGLDTIEENADLRNSLYCLFPFAIGGQAILAKFSRQFFIEITKNGQWNHFIESFFIKHPPAKKTQPQTRRIPHPQYDLVKGRFIPRRRL